MKIHLNKVDLKKLESLIKVKNDNIIASEMFSYLLNERFYQDENESSYSKEAFDYLNDDGNCSYIYNIYFTSAFKEVNHLEYSNNQYFKNIKLTTNLMDKYSLLKDKYLSFEMFPLSEITSKQEDLYIEHYSFGYFNCEFEFIALNQNNVTWMSITPNEINTMKEDVKKAFGNVLVVGLGLGYFPYMISLKNDVKSITIIEKEKEVIEMFNSEMLPQFENMDKINIICKDIYQYLKENKNSFDYVFIDIWHDPVEGLFHYIKLQKYHLDNDHYWLKDSIIYYARRLIILLFEECLEQLTSKDYQKANTIEDRIINGLYHELENMTFDTFDEIMNTISKENIEKLLVNVKI